MVTFVLGFPLLRSIFPTRIIAGRRFGRLVRIDRSEPRFLEFAVERRNILLLDFRPARM